LAQEPCQSHWIGRHSGKRGKVAKNLKQGDKGGPRVTLTETTPDLIETARKDRLKRSEAQAWITD
jgi:hypothetical protein